MPLFGVDAHPVFQAGLPIEQLPSAGIGFLSVKVSQGTDSSYLAKGSADWIRRGKAAGLVCLSYHYLVPGNEEAQARVFAAALKTTGVPGVLDAEALDTKDNPTLTLAGIRAFLTACRQLGANVPLLYYPAWYWERMSRPLLTGLPVMLWASSYPSKTAGTAAELYNQVGPARWTSYAGLPVAVLQFAETGIVAGHHPVDLNAFPATREQLLSIITRPTTQRTENDPLQNFRVAGDGLLPLVCPVGPVSAITAEAWVSAVVDGPDSGSVRFWFQSDTAGITSVSRSIAFADGRSARVVEYVPPGTTMIRVEHHFKAGGTIALETRSKPLP